MSQTGQVFDAETIADGNSVTSSKFQKSDAEGMTLQLLGDSNTTDIDVIVLTRANSSVNEYSPYVSSLNNVDLSQHENDSKAYPVDIADIGEFKLKIVNNSGAEISLDGYYRFN